MASSAVHGAVEKTGDLTEKAWDGSKNIASTVVSGAANIGAKSSDIVHATADKVSGAASGVVEGWSDFLSSFHRMTIVL